MSEKKVLTIWNDEKINEDAMNFLRQQSTEVAVPFDEETKKNIKYLIDAFLERDDGVGLAAPQVGIRKRIIVFRTKKIDEKEWSKGEGDYEVLINPRITQVRGEMLIMTEGCLSCPEIQVEIARFPEIKIRAYDVHGEKINQRYANYIARIVQHEIDHLDGRLIIDYEGAVYVPKNRQNFFATFFNQR